MSWLSSIYYKNAWPEKQFIHVAYHTLDEDIYIEISDDDGGTNAGRRLTKSEALEMADVIQTFGLKA